MADIKYEKLDRIREDIKRDKEKLLKLQEQIKAKEAKLKEAEANQIVADVGAMNMSPEQLGEFLALIQSGGLRGLLDTMNKPEKGESQIEKNNDYDESEDYVDEN